jgi:selenium metabolism protein YedF
MEKERILDCSGLTCPQPVMQTREALEKMEGGRLRVILDNESSHINVRRFAESQGHQVHTKEMEGLFHVMIMKGEGISAASESQPIRCEAPQQKRTVVYISSEGMGRGDDQLGDILMAAYLDTLSQFAKEITHLIFVNSGVKLVVEGSIVLEQIQELQRMGIEVLACGTCLNHFGIKAQLQVGSVSNMFAILEVLSGAGKILSP